jgi:hypothetical protein
VLEKVGVENVIVCRQLHFTVNLKPNLSSLGTNRSTPIELTKRMLLRKRREYI